MPFECRTCPAVPIPPLACTPTVVPITNLVELATTAVPTESVAALTVEVANKLFVESVSDVLLNVNPASAPREPPSLN